MIYSWRAGGIANFYSIITDAHRTGGGEWVAQIQLNGQPTREKREQFMNTLVSALNGLQSEEPLYNPPLYP